MTGERFVQFFRFDGTASRKEWLTTIGLLISALMLLYQLDRADILPVRLTGATELLGLVIAAAVSTRRLHDLGISSRWLGGTSVFAISGGPILLTLTSLFVTAPLSFSMAEDGVPDPEALERAMRFGGFIEKLGANGLIALLFIVPTIPLLVLLLLMATRKGGSGPEETGGEDHPWGYAPDDAVPAPAFSPASQDVPERRTPARQKPQGFGRKGL